MVKSKIGAYLFSQLIALIVFVGLIMLVFSTSGKFFIFELFVLAVFIFIAFFSSIGTYFSMRWGWTMLSFLYALVLLDLLLIYFWTKNIELVYFVTTVVSAIGFIIAISNIKPEEAEPVKKEFKPGKFVSSNKASFYHAPKCDWAKKIKKDNMIWYNSEEEAKSKGLKPHNCLK